MDRPQQVSPAGTSPRPRAARKRLAPSLVTPGDNSNSNTNDTDTKTATTATTTEAPTYSVSANEAVSLRLIARAEDVVDDVAASAAARAQYTRWSAT